MEDKRRDLRRWMTHRLESFCAVYKEIQAIENDVMLDNTVRHVEDVLLPVLKSHCELRKAHMSESVAAASRRLSSWAAVSNGDEITPIKTSKGNQLLQMLQVAHAAFDGASPNDTIERLHSGTLGEMNSIVGHHVNSWNDAIHFSLPILAKEDYANKVMATQQLDLPGKSKYTGSLVSSFCSNVFVGIDFERSPGVILKRVFSDKIDGMRKYLKKTCMTYREQINQHSILADCEVVMTDGKCVSEKSKEGTKCIQDSIEKMDALLQTNDSIEQNLMKISDEYVEGSKRLWWDAIRLKYWDIESFQKYFQGSGSDFRSFQEHIDYLEAVSSDAVNSPKRTESHLSVKDAYKRLARLAEKSRKSFAAQVSALYDHFLAENALYIGPSHCIRNGTNYAEEIFMQVGFRFVLSNTLAKKSARGGAQKSKRSRDATSEKVEDDETTGNAINDACDSDAEGSRTSIHEKKTPAKSSTSRKFRHIEIQASCETQDPFGIEYPQNLIPDEFKFYFSMGHMPVMVKSDMCVLRRLEKIQKPIMDYFEDTQEFGGHFIVKGSEKLLRILTCAKTNVPLCLERDHFSKNGINFSNKAIAFNSEMGSGRVVRTFFHYLTNGEIFAAVRQRRMHFVPVVLLLLCLKNVSLYSLQRILQSGVQSDLSMSRIEALIKQHGAKPYAGVLGPKAHLMILGRLFRHTQEESPISISGFPMLPQCLLDGENSTPQRSDEWYGMYVIRRYLFPHLNATIPFDDFENHPEELANEHSRKFDLLLHVIYRMYHFVDGIIPKDSVDKQSHQALFTPGKMVVGVVSDAINRTLAMISRDSVLHYKSEFDAVMISSDVLQNPLPVAIEQYLRYVGSEQIVIANHLPEPISRLTRVISTGNYIIDKDFGSPAPQILGLSIAYERLNAFRQIELLRTVHRGKSVADSRSSEIRRCRQESWGFLCVVNTPDGHLCGVSQQLSLSATITTNQASLQCLKRTKKSFKKHIIALEKEFQWEGMSPIAQAVLKAAREFIVSGWPHPHEQRAKMPTFCVDGCISGYIAKGSSVKLLGDTLRAYKALPNCPFPFAEVIEQDIPFPGGLLVFTTAGTLVRPIQLIASSHRMMVGPWEQTYLDIASVHADIAEATDKRLTRKAQFKYIEPDPAATLSFTANAIPFFEHNCSPRNLFVCGILKQSLGNPIPNVTLRHDTKTYVMPNTHRHLVGTDLTSTHDMRMKSVNLNAVVAIMSYSGLDMEDAIVMNQSCIDRGMFDGHVLTGRSILAATKMRRSALDAEQSTGKMKTTIVFHNVKFGMAFGEKSTLYCEGAAPNGLPLLRRASQHTFCEPTFFPWTPMYVIAKKITLPDGAVRYVDHKVFTWGEFMENYDDSEAGWVHSAVPVAFDGPDPVEVFLLTRRNRNTVVGDKFSSRHGQKGTLSYLMGQRNMPFCMNSGVVPDILINPHAFPSRMTVGMMLELAAGKVVAHSGKLWNASPWGGDVRWDPALGDIPDADTAQVHPSAKSVRTTKSESRSQRMPYEPSPNSMAVNAIGKELLKYGFEPFAGEEMINGETGEPIAGDVFIGVCGYQKLRHLVKDKWQTRGRTDHVRSRVVKKTGQPQAGKRRHGGNRVGEMERDALLSHGVTEVLIDRLMHCSDHTRGYVCKECGGMFTIAEKCATATGTFKFCYYCALKKRDENLSASADIVLMDMPQVLKLLVAEMQSVGIRIAMKF